MPNAACIPSTTADGQVYSDHATYATARTGGTLTVDTADASDGVGQSTEYRCRELFLGFDTALPTGAVVTLAKLFLFVHEDHSDTDFTIEVRQYNWGTSLTTADWVSGANLSSWTYLGGISTAGISTVAYTELSIQAAFVVKTGYTRFLLNSSRHRQETTPTGDEWVRIYLGDAAAAYRPYLYIEYTLDGIDYTKRVYWGTRVAERGTSSPEYARIEAEEGIRSFEREKVAGARSIGGAGFALNSYLAYTVDVPTDGIVLPAATYVIEVPKITMGAGEFMTLQALVVHDGGTITGDSVVIAGDPVSGLNDVEGIILPVTVSAERLCTALQFRVKVAALTGGSFADIVYIGGATDDDVKIGAQEGQAATAGWPRRTPVLSLVNPVAGSHPAPTLLAGHPTFELLADFLYPTDVLTLTRYVDRRRSELHIPADAATLVSAESVYKYTRGVTLREHGRRTLKMPVQGATVGEWDAVHAYALNDVILDSNSHVQKVVVAGTSGGSEPSWRTDGGITLDADASGVWWLDCGAQIELAPPAACRNIAPTATLWQPGQAYGISSYVLPSYGDHLYYNGLFAGTSGATEPDWPMIAGEIVNDNGIAWKDQGERYQYGVNTYYELTASDGTGTIATIGAELLLDVQNPKLVSGEVDPPTLTAEADTDTETEVTLEVTDPVSWDPADGPLWFLYSITGPDGITVYHSAGNSLHLHRLSAGTYTWTAKSIDPWGRTSDYQTADVFVVTQVGSLPTCELDPLPAVIYEQPRSVWSTRDADLQAQDAYQLEIATDAGFTLFEYQSGVVASTAMHYQHSGLAVGLKYRRCRVRTNGVDWSTYDTDSFTLAAKTSQADDLLLYRRHPDGIKSRIWTPVRDVQARKRLDGPGEFSFQINQFALPALRNLYGMWEFEETSGAVAHDVWGGNNLALTGSPPWLAGQGLHLESGDYAQSADLAFTLDSDFTIYLVFYVYRTRGTLLYLGSYAGDANYYELEMVGDGLLQLNANDGSGEVSSWTVAVPISDWCCIQLRRSGAGDVHPTGTPRLALGRFAGATPGVATIEAVIAGLLLYSDDHTDAEETRAFDAYQTSLIHRGEVAL